MMESIVDSIPTSLTDDLSKKLVKIVLDTPKRNGVPSELAKKIIYLWRQDQLASPSGLEALLEAAVNVNTGATFEVLDELGLNKVTVELKAKF